MSWLETARQWVGRVPAEVTIKNTVAQIAKEFYGFGPRAPLRVWLEGRLIVHAVPLEGAAVLTDLRSEPGGHAVMEYLNRLLVRRYRTELSGLAELALGVRVLALFTDIDIRSGHNVGVALVDRDLGPRAAPAPAPLARAWREAAHQALGSHREARGGDPGGPYAVIRTPHLLYLQGPAPPLDDPLASDGAPCAVAEVARWRRSRDALVESLAALAARNGIEVAVTFCGIDGNHLIAGAVIG